MLALAVPKDIADKNPDSKFLAEEIKKMPK